MHGRARRGAVALVAAMTAVIAATAFSAADAAPVSALTALDGRLMVAHGDNFSNGAMVMQTELQTASGVVPIQLSAEEHAQALALAGQQVRMSGTRLSKSFAAASVTPLAVPSALVAPSATSGVARTMRVAVVLMRLPGSTAEPVTSAAVQASTFGAADSVANWFSQTSGGQVAVTGTVYGYFDGVRSCDLATQTAAAAVAAAQDGYVASNYDDLVVYTPDQACGFGGIAWVGGNGVFLSGTVDRGVIEHELGHNLGLLHAGEYACGAAVRSASCLVDYGDPTDVMGATGPNHGYSAEHKFMLGWIPASKVKTVSTGTQTITLTAAENPLAAGSTELIHVRAADGALFAIDLRASAGYDAGLSGVWIRQVAEVNTDDTELVRNSALAAALTFTDPARHVTIKTLAQSGSTASVRVCIDACAATVTTASTSTMTSSVAAHNIATGAKSSATNANTTLTVRAGHGVVAGRTVVLSAFASGRPGSISCSDSSHNAYSVDVNSLGAQRLIVCSAFVTHALAAGSKITVKYPVFSGGSVASVNEFSNIAAGTRHDKLRVKGGSSTAVASGTTATTTHAAELVFGVEIHQGTANFAPAPGHTRVGAVTFFSGIARRSITPVFEVVAATGAFELGGTLTSAQQWRAAIVTYFEG